MNEKFLQFFNSNNEFKYLDLSLDRIRNALKDIKFYEKDLGRIIHIAGTNGKGSTAYYLAQLLHQNNFSTGLFISPHIDDITERIRYNLEKIDHKKFQNYFKKNFSIIRKHSLTFFEALTLIAFNFFSDKNIHFSIIETGLGGRYDATNVLDDKVPVITTISQDHKKYLGTNIYNIIDEKIAICKNNRHIFIGNNKEFINNYIAERLSGKELHFLNYSKKGELTGLNAAGINKAFAAEIYQFLTGSKPNLNTVTLNALPCRMEKIGSFTLDGAHNISALYEIVKSNETFDAIVFSCTQDRDIEKMINVLKRTAKSIYVTEIPGNDRSIDISNIDIEGVYRIKDPKALIDRFKEKKENYKVLITGSLYFCAYCRKYIKGDT